MLARQGQRLTILKAADEPAAARRARWDSLRSSPPCATTALPGRPFPGDPDSHPARDDVVTYPTDYAREFELPVELNSAVRSVRRADDDVSYVVELDRAPVEADKVVIATVPDALRARDRRLDPDIVHFHSTAYRNPAEVPSGPVLVVATRG